MPLRGPASRNRSPRTPKRAGSIRTIATSVQQTLLMNRRHRPAHRARAAERVAGGDDGIRVIGLGLSGRRDEARQLLAVMGQRLQHPDLSGLDDAPRRVARIGGSTTWRSTLATIASLEDLRRSRGDLSGRLAVLRRRRVPSAGSSSCSAAWRSATSRRDARRVATVRCAARRSGVPARCWPMPTPDGSARSPPFETRAAIAYSRTDAGD